MESSFYMRVGVTENLINPQVRLDGKWEVSLCDISLHDPSLKLIVVLEQQQQPQDLGKLENLIFHYCQ